LGIKSVDESTINSGNDNVDAPTEHVVGKKHTSFVERSVRNAWCLCLRVRRGFVRKKEIGEDTNHRRQESYGAKYLSKRYYGPIKEKHRVFPMLFYKTKTMKK